MAVVKAAAIVPPAWVCGNAAVPAKMPAMGENRTSVPNPYLPLECAGRKQ
jgi:type IV pilus assembly protein PilA